MDDLLSRSFLMYILIYTLYCNYIWQTWKDFLSEKIAYIMEIILKKPKFPFLSYI